MTHPIPQHLAFCTLGQNQKARQGTNLETLKTNEQTQKQLHISQWISRNGQHPTRRELKNQDIHENHPSISNMAR